MRREALSALGVKTKRKGVVLLLFSTILLTSLLSYSSSDNCINVVSDLPTKNLLGSFGAIIADILYQYFGFAIFTCFPFIFYLSFTYITKRKPRFLIFKIIYTFILTLCITFLLGCITKYQYLFTISLGGRIGMLLNKLAPFLFIKITAFMSIIGLIIIYPYAVFVFGKKTNQQILKQKKTSPFQITLFIFIKKTHETIKITWFILTSPIKMIKIICSSLKKSKKRKIKQQTKNTNENINRITLEENIKTYTPPVASLLKVIEKNNVAQSQNICKNNLDKLAKILGDFGVRGDMIGYKPGPIVTLYEFKPQAGVKASRIIGLADDIARTMMVSSVRTATISGRDTLGIEVPNKDREIVCFRRLIESQEYQYSNANIPMILGCNIFGKPIIADLTDMPHLLIAGTTGSGKSVGINGMILSMLYKLSPEECKLIMIDPKMLEFSAYEGIPHLMLPVITDAKNAVLALKWVVREMENRYKMMAEAGVRNITGYNQKAKLNMQNTQANKHDYELDIQPMHYIVVIIDEMADLMVVAGKEIEVLVQRLSQMARAAGIHLIMATQRPSVDVITGVIKANFPTRISYHVTSKIDSRTILGEQGAEQLLGKGDMLFMLGGTKTLRVHGPMITDDEVENVVNYIKKYNQKPEYIILTNNDENDDNWNTDVFDNDNDNTLYRQAVKIVITEKKTSISYLQRKLRIGYNKAANFIEKMEEDGILSSPDQSGKRILIKENND